MKPENLDAFSKFREFFESKLEEQKEDGTLSVDNMNLSADEKFRLSKKGEQ